VSRAPTATLALACLLDQPVSGGVKPSRRASRRARSILAASSEAIDLAPSRIAWLRMDSGTS
jgi:hypothetical protein